MLILICLFSTIAKADEQFAILDSSQDALQSRVDTIQNARQELILCYFTFDQDEVSTMLLSLLKQASNRGVNVKLLVDAYYNGMSKAMMKLVKENGIDLKLYAPFNLFKPGRWWKRMHNKFLIADGEILLSGGRNVKNEYFGMHESHNYIDRDIIVASKKAAQTARNYFFDLWNSKVVKTPKTKHVKDKKIIEAKKNLAKGRELLVTHPTLRLNTGNIWVKEINPLDEYEFIYDPIKKKSHQGTGDRLLKELEQASSSVKIETPYFVLTNRMMKLLKKLRKRGVSIRILTNSLSSSDVILSQASYLNRRNKLLKMGVELHEVLTSKIGLHAKSYVIDNSTAIIGTFNFNGRSLHQDFEVLTLSRNTDVVDELNKSMEQHLEYARLVEQDGTLEGFNVKFPEVKLGKKIGAFLTRILLAPILRVQI